MYTFTKPCKNDVASRLSGDDVLRVTTYSHHLFFHSDFREGVGFWSFSGFWTRFSFFFSFENGHHVQCSRQCLSLCIACCCAFWAVGVSVISNLRPAHYCCGTDTKGMLTVCQASLCSPYPYLITVQPSANGQHVLIG